MPLADAEVKEMGLSWDRDRAKAVATDRLKWQKKIVAALWPTQDEED